MIKLQNINVYYNKNTNLENHVLKNIELTIPDQQFLTIVGGNGAGKSTIMDILSGNILPCSGEVQIDKQDVTKLSTIKRSSLVARVFQDPRVGTYSDLTIEENMSIASKRGGFRGLKPGITQNLRACFKTVLAELGMNLENRLNDKVENLSGGQRQALSLIMATLVESKILLLDEHTSALDPKMGEIIMDLTNKIIKKNNLTTIMVTHSMRHAIDYGDRTIMLYHGEIILDINGETRKSTSPAGLIKYFDLY